MLVKVMEMGMVMAMGMAKGMAMQMELGKEKVLETLTDVEM